MGDNRWAGALRFIRNLELWSPVTSARRETSMSEHGRSSKDPGGTAHPAVGRREQVNS